MSGIKDALATSKSGVWGSLMELPVAIRFEVPDQDITHWRGLLAGLCEGKQEAWLENQIAYFGKEAEAAISDLMDSCETEHGSVFFEGLEQQGNRFQVQMIGGYGVIDCLPKVEALLALCRVQGLELTPEMEE